MNDIPLFEGIQTDELAVMLECMGAVVSSYEKNATIMPEQNHVRQLGIVLSGTVRTVMDDIWGNRTIIGDMKRGDTFGEVFALDEKECGCLSVIAVSETKILLLPFLKIMHTCSRRCDYHHRLADNLLKSVTEKNLYLMEKMQIVSKKSLREKIMSYLSLQAKRSSSIYFEIPFGRVGLADYLCADRSALTRELNAMRNDGLIDFDKNTFRIFVR